MKIKALFDLVKVGIIAYICLILGWGPLAVSSYAKITVRATDEPVKVITIEKGDTLWYLAGEYLSDPRKWPEFKKYNEFTNPDLIYPGEKMLVPVKVAKEMRVDLEKELAKLREAYEDLSKKFTETSKELRELRGSLNYLKAQSRRLRSDFGRNQQRIDQVKSSLSKLERRVARSEEATEQSRKAIVGQLTKRVYNASGKLEKRINSLEEMISSKMEEIAAKEEEIAKLKEDMDSISKRVSSVEKAISKLDAKIKAAEWPYEKPSKNKRILTFLAALVGAVTWATISAR